MKLEICANSFQSAKNAQIAGAHRVELCSELAVGGITPSFGLLSKVITDLSIETYVLIRPRSGNFHYSEEEFEIMKKNIEVCKELGCNGIVSGVLNKDNSIDVDRTKEVVALSMPLPFTFHRAYDLTPNLSEALDILIKLGVTRVLTSGQMPSAQEGLKALSSLKEKAEGKIIVLPGGGVSVKNSILFKNAGFKEIHASLSSVKRINEKPIIALNSIKHFDETSIRVSDVKKIQALLKTIE